MAEKRQNNTAKPKAKSRTVSAKRTTQQKTASGTVQKPTGKVRGNPDKLVHWKKGQSGNPAGRPKGLRNIVTQDFLQDVITVWNEPNAEGNRRGIDALRELRSGELVTAVGKLVPREINLDDETQEGFAGIWAMLAKASESKDE